MSFYPHERTVVLIHGFCPGYSAKQTAQGKSKQELVNPIDPKLSDQEKVLQLEQLRDEAIPVFRGLLKEISNKLGISTKDNLKDNQGAIDKTHRKDKPEWYSLEHLMDYYRGMVTLTDQRQIIDIAKMIDARGMGVVEFEYMKTIKPEGSQRKKD